MNGPGQSLSPKGVLRALLDQRGYRDARVLGTFTSHLRDRHYVVAILNRDGPAHKILRGPFAELREAIRALPGALEPYRAAF